MLTANRPARGFYDRLGFHALEVRDAGPLTYHGVRLQPGGDTTAQGFSLDHIRTTEVPRMADDIATEALRDAEHALQRAQLAGDADSIDALLDDRLVFTGPDGVLYGKQDDLDLQRSGEQSMSRVEEESLAVLVAGTTGVTWFLGSLAGVFKGEPFEARVRYTRTWIQDDAGRWRLLTAHVSEA
jgi:hypothetical protein